MNNDLLAAGLLLGGSSVALALTALAARRALRAATRAEFAAKNSRADMRAAAEHATRACGRATDAGDWCEASKRYAEHSIKAANAASLDNLFTAAGITVTQAETVDVIPIPVPKPKLYREVDDTPGSVIEIDDSSDVLGFASYWRDNGTPGGA